MWHAMLDGVRNRNPLARGGAKRKREGTPLRRPPMSLERTLDRKGKSLRASVPAKMERPTTEDADAVGYLLASLSPQEWGVLMAWFAGRKQKEIARDLGVSPSRVSQVLLELVGELRARAAGCPHLRECCV
jgi:RNA polymerase sigma factor (sigma-70 family)